MKHDGFPQPVHKIKIERGKLMMMVRKKSSKWIGLTMGLLLMSQSLGAMAYAAPTSPNKSGVSSYIPQQMNVPESDQTAIEDSVAYGLIDAVSIIGSEPDSVWAQQFKTGSMRVNQVVPIYDLDGNLSETMVVFDHGYIISEASNGEIIQFSFGDIDPTYFDGADRVYSHNNDHFAVKNNTAIDSNYKGKHLDEIKKEVSPKEKSKLKEKPKRFGQLSKKSKDFIFNGFVTGANEGNSTQDIITSPPAWMINFFQLSSSVVSSWSAPLVDSYFLNASNINQSNLKSNFLTSTDTDYANDCAVMSTLEIMGYKWGALTNAQKRTAYNAIVGSSYFSSSGVGYDKNDQIFKVGSEAIGKATQQTSDDPEKYLNINNYSTLKSYLQNYGPYYLSFNQNPYGAHTVTVKGTRQYNLTINYTTGGHDNYSEGFIQINDHWQPNGVDAFMNIDGLSITTYLTAIVAN
ncbi:hypothetical protein [Paenibacillus sp. MMS18-CY102]|uniref:hypothetical protein n=1 Tax=Paenibacillus sp. MMS18-CY102 TaxID=2682849 RepID=UPI001365F85B|nr:hypothetical protein [Paenibacillus sp. MMS18-CY102]MWC26979.1 hypothetical protein [Paenibacillus sp. MMS18-CY102]